MKEEENTPMMQNTVNNFAVPFAIMVAGLAIAAAVYFSDGKNGSVTTPQGTQNQNIVLDPLTSADHILGNPKAKIVVVEYSDTECPYCKVFHETMNRIVNEYSTGGQVAWVYRQFPIAGLHPKALKESQATECAAKLGGNTKFWEYINKLFEITPSNNNLDLAKLPEIAREIGLDETTFNACLSSGEMKAVVDAGIASAAKAGARGTPYSVILVNNKVAGTIDGAQPYEVVKAQIEELLK